jgi:hypothetical protein
MSCSVSIGFNIGCKEAAGGIKEIYILDWDEIKDLATFNGTQQFLDVTSAITLYKYVLVPQTASFSETINTSEENGTVFYTQTVGLKLHTLAQDKRNELQSIAKGRQAIFVRDEQDIFWLVGYERGAIVTQGTANTGTAMGDFNGYDLIWTAVSRVRATSCVPYEAVPFDFSENITID